MEENPSGDVRWVYFGRLCEELILEGPTFPGPPEVILSVAPRGAGTLGSDRCPRTPSRSNPRLTPSLGQNRTPLHKGSN